MHYFLDKGNLKESKQEVSSKKQKFGKSTTENCEREYNGFIRLYTSSVLD